MFIIFVSKIGLIVPLWLKICKIGFKNCLEALRSNDKDKITRKSILSDCYETENKRISYNQNTIFTLNGVCFY